jgi:hypothetical protein
MLSFMGGERLVKTKTEDGGMKSVLYKMLERSQCLFNFSVSGLRNIHVMIQTILPVLLASAIGIEVDRTINEISNGNPEGIQ